LVGGAVFDPPYRGARELLQWAIELWPYINGKALMSGIRLLEMEASEMLDVIHYLFEEDLVSTHPELVEAKTEMRDVIYRDLYEESYNYGIKTSKNKYNSLDRDPPSDGFYGDLKPFDPTAGPTKPYTPPTDFDEDSPLPFGSSLDAPLL